MTLLQREKTIDFRTFCAGGSPEYVDAKQRLKTLYERHKNEAKKRERPIRDRSESFKAYSIYINPLAFFDPTFMLIGAGVVLVAVIEHQLAKNGLVTIASSLSTILRIAFPVIAAGSIIYLLSHSSFLLM